MSSNLHNYTAAERAYAISLFGLANESNQSMNIALELKEVLAVVEAEPKVLELLSSVILPVETREAIYRRIFEGKVSDLLFRFLAIVVRRNRFGDLLGIARAFAALIDDHFGTLEVDAYTAIPLDDATALRISSHINAVTGRQVRLNRSIEPSMISGIRLRIGDQIIDGSAATQLRKMREQLLESGRQAARSALDRHIA